MTRSTIGRVADGLWLIGLAIYILAGIDAVPFHGDESTIIMMSRDYHYLVQKRDVDPVLYTANPADPEEQWLRVVNGTVSKMAIGVVWDAAGLTVHDLNTQWLWGAGWDWNVQNGHMPGDRLLRAARWSSALMLVISAWAIFGIAWRVAAGPIKPREMIGVNLTDNQTLLSAWSDRSTRPSPTLMPRVTAYISSAIYITTPAVLMNGRRAMFEGAHLCFVLLMVLAAIMLIRTQQNPAHTRRVLVGWAILTGILGGVAIASKHTAGLAVGAVFIALFAEPLIRATPPRSLPLTLTERIRTYSAGRWLRFTVMTLVVIGVFVALNPAWWSAPLDMPGSVYDLRRELLDGQKQNFFAYTTWDERVVALAENTFWAAPQYYESYAWRDYDAITAQIADYEDSWLAGRKPYGTRGTIWGVVLVTAFVFGGSVLMLRWREGPAWLVLVWLVITALVVLLTTPLNWQRYYLPLHPIMAVIAGLGVGWIVDSVWRGR